MKRKIWVEAFRLNENASGNVILENILTAIGDTSLHTREMDFGGEAVRMEELGEYRSECWEASFFRVRQTRLPHVVGRGEPAMPLVLTDHQGLGEPTAFLYHPGTRVVMIHRSREGVPLPSILRYLQEKDPQHQKLQLDPLLREDALERLNGLRRIKQMRVKLAGVSPGLFNKPGTTMRAYREMAEELRAPQILIELSMGNQRKGSISVDKCVAWAKELLDMQTTDTAEVQDLTITGETDGNTNVVPLDLLEERIRVQVDLEEGPDRTVSFVALCQSLREAWHLYEDRFKKMFPARKAP